MQASAGQSGPSATAVSAADPRLPVAMIATLVVPGLGHVVLGRRFKGVMFAAVLLGVMWLGLDLASYCNFTEQARERHPVMFVVQWLNGLPAVLAFLMRPDTYPPGTFANPKIFEIGVLYTCIAGLLNVLLLIDLAGLPAREQLQARLEAARKQREEHASADPSPAAGAPPPAALESPTADSHQPGSH